MRTNCNWFINKAQTFWNAQPGRSILILVPQGCNEIEASQLVRSWTESNFIPPYPFEKNKPICINLSADSTTSCVHFAKRLSKLFRHLCKFELELETDDYPTDIIQATVEAVLASGFYPIIAIERFHAFASIKDIGMTSVLSGMRTLENSGQLTTLSFSPLNYAMIRRQMLEGLPFLNSVYGDNHDEVVMSTLSRQEFLDYASSRGISAQRSNALYSKGGGPDAVYKVLVDIADTQDSLIIGRCLARTEETINKFLDRSFIFNGETDKNLIAKLALGKLLAQEKSFILNNPLHSFLAKEKPGGELVCSSQIIARQILRGDQPEWKIYGQCIDALCRDQLEAAAEIANTLEDQDLRLTAFKDLVLLKATLRPKPGVGLLGIEWADVAKITKRLSKSAYDLPPAITAWIVQTETMTLSIIASAMGPLSRLQLDSLTSSSNDIELRKLTLFLLGDYIKATSGLESPTQRIIHLVNIPEAILQVILRGFCGINHLNFDNKFPDAPYDKFFSSAEIFNLPLNGSKVALRSLLVMVPAILSLSPQVGCGPFIDERMINQQQQKLVDCVRNPASHTMVAFLENDASFLHELCKLWINSWCQMEGYDDYTAFAATRNQPMAHEISSIILE